MTETKPTTNLTIVPPTPVTGEVLPPKRRGGNPKGTRPPRAGIGRPKGTKNKIPALLKEAVIRAAELEGFDRKGKQGLIGYCRMLARDEKKAFATLMGRVLPLQVYGDKGNHITIVISAEDAKVG